MIDIQQLSKQIRVLYRVNDKRELDGMNNFLHSWMEKICRQHSFFHLLIKMREISYDSVSEFIDLAFPNLDINSKILTFQEAVLAATNFILIYSNNELNINNIAERHYVDNMSDVVQDAELLLFIAATARYNNFRLNTAARIKHAESMKLIESYVDRQLKQKANFCLPTDDHVILNLVSPLTLPKEMHDIRISKNGQSSSYYYKNYFPFAVDGQSVREQFSHLNCSAFSDVVGMPFDEFY